MKESPILPSGIFAPADVMACANASAFTDIQPMGEGAFCRVLRARRQGQWWCLKTLKEEYVGQPFYEGLLNKEYSLLCRLSHSSVVRAVGMEHVEGIGECIVQELVSGPTLDKAKGTRETRRRWYEQLVEVVGYIHGQQVVHRDLKPQNVLVTDNGQHIKLIDFGLADSDNYAELKQAAGTLRYISPEQMDGGLPDVRNDIYSLGVILDEMRLGLAYRLVAKCCRRRIDRRYENVEQLQRAVRRAHQWPLAAMQSAVIMLFVAVVVWLALAGPLRKEERSLAAAVHEPDTVVLVATPDSPPPSPAIEAAPSSAPQAVIPAAEKVYPEACGRVDRYMREHHYANLLSTLQHEPSHPPFQGRLSERHGELATACSRFMNELWPAVAAIRDAYAEELGPVQAAALYTSLVEYAQAKYTNELLTALHQYEQREREYHRTLSSD